MGREPDMGIEGVDLHRRAVDLAPADVGGGVNDLTLKIGQRHDVVIDHSNHADAGRSEIHQRRGAETARADHQNGSVLQHELSRAADLAQHNMAGVAFEFVGT